MAGRYAIIDGMEPDLATPPNLTEVPRDDDIQYRTFPHNIEAEQALLGVILVNNTAYERVSGFLTQDHFYEPLHGRIFEAARILIDRHQTATPVTLKNFFEEDEALQEIGGTEYLARLAASAITVINAESYGTLIYDLALRRELISIGEDVVNNAYDSPLDMRPMEQVEQAEGQLYKLAEDGKHEGGFISFGSSLTTAIGTIESAYKREGKLTGVATGMDALDQLLGGLHKSDLIILAGRPSMGKTALATNIAFNAAKARATARRKDDEDTDDSPVDGAVVGFFSLEMSAEQLATRILSEQSEMPSEHLRRGQLDDNSFLKLVRASQDLENIPLFIDDTPALTIDALRSRARRLKRQHKLSFVIVDYLQLLRASNQRRNDNRVQEVSEITQGLKALAKELDVPVLALSQLSRAVEQREDKRPQLADLRESGSIEQDADVVMFVFRQEYYHERAEPTPDTPEHAEWQEMGEKLHGKADVIIGKQRHGPTGTAHLQFTREFTRFSDIANEYSIPERRS